MNEILYLYYIGKMCQISYDIINRPKKIFKEIYSEIHLFEKVEINIDEIIPTYSKYDFSKESRTTFREGNI